MKSRKFLIPSLLILTVIALAVGCGKSNSSVKPVISIKSLNSPVPPGGNLLVTLSFNDKASDLGQGVFVAIRQRLNQQPLPPGVQFADTVTGPIPQFPDRQKGEFQFNLDYNFLHETDHINDTITFKFAAIDRKGVSSDTITTQQIVIINP